MSFSASDEEKGSPGSNVNAEEQGRSPEEKYEEGKVKEDCGVISKIVVSKVLSSRSHDTINDIAVADCCGQIIPEKLQNPRYHQVGPGRNKKKCEPTETPPQTPRPTGAPKKKSGIRLLRPSEAESQFYQSLIDNMAQEIPLFPKATSMYIHTGNILNWNRLKKKKLNLSPTDELCDCISKSLEDYLKSPEKTKLQYETEIYSVNNENIVTFEDTESRDEVKVTVKVFVCATQPPQFIAEAVDKVLGELRLDFIETLLLTVSPQNVEDEDYDQQQQQQQTDQIVPMPVTLSTLEKYWQVMEDLVKKDKVLTLGVCDVNKDTLEDLYNTAKVKPSIDQVNLESCCVMPKDLVEYAKTVNIQLLTHNDSPVFLTKERLQQTIQQVATERDSDAWGPQWVVRYSGIIKSRGIIKMKGYIFHAERDNKKRIL